MWNITWISHTKRSVYVQNVTLRLPTFIMCAICHSKSLVSFILDSYDLNLCLGKINIYTSRPYLACYICKEPILITNMQCSRCKDLHKKDKYCKACGKLQHAVYTKIIHSD